LAAGKNKKRILEAAISLFNHRGVSAVSTNLICEELGISPGNLYFHFRNKEAIVRELFQQMCEETYEFWEAELKSNELPMKFIEDSLEVFWKFRFFHREMYQLRREDPALNKVWHQHIEKTRRFMKAAYARWAKQGHMERLADPHAMVVLRDLVLLTASSFFQFYESAEKPATKRTLRLARDYLAAFLSPYFSASYRETLKRESMPG
jgi:AcrR family transcriptional regulator